MNPHAAHPVSPMGMARSLWCNRKLIMHMTKRDVVGRYKGSVMGLLWSLLNPVFMLVIYTVVFSAVFKARWGLTEQETKTQFAVVLFAGLIVHGLLAEVLSRAPDLIVGNANYVKKVVFPLEILPAVTLGDALFHTLVSLFVLVMAFFIFMGIPPVTVVLVPFVIIPLAILALGLGWILAALGVYIRDIGQIVRFIIFALLFLSPVFFPVSALPESYQTLIMANPLSFIIEQARNVLIWGRLPNWAGLGIYTVVSCAIAWMGYAWFQKTRKGFADVI
jgi:lipopolysaccharide transport system permease protein